MALISLWTFDDPATVVDSVSSDGTAQNGTYVNGASAPGGTLVLDGTDDYALIPADNGFQLDQGTLTLEVTPDTVHQGTLFSRDSNGIDDGGHFTMKVLSNGQVMVRHQDDTTSHFFHTSSSFYDAGDRLKITYSWASDGSGGEFVVENLTQCTTDSQTITTPLTWDQVNTNEPITLGASQRTSSDNTADNLVEYYDGTIGHVAIYDTVEPAGGVICFAGDTLIQTPMGQIRARDLSPGDKVVTGTSGAQRILWVGQRRIAQLDMILKPNLRPIRIKAGALGNGLPLRDLRVSRQHRILLETPLAQATCGAHRVLIAANKLLPLPGVSIDQTVTEIDYVHFLCDRHQIVFAEGAPAETLLPGPQAMRLVGPRERQRLMTKCPGVANGITAASPAALIPTGRQQKDLIAAINAERRAECVSAT